jgi:hypothetical protein
LGRPGPPGSALSAYAQTTYAALWNALPGKVKQKIKKTFIAKIVPKKFILGIEISCFYVIILST